MSGGHFEYAQSNFEAIAFKIDVLVETERNNYSPQTIAVFRKAAMTLRQAKIYVDRIDWLVSGDDSEYTFHVRLTAELAKE